MWTDGGSIFVGEEFFTTCSIEILKWTSGWSNSGKLPAPDMRLILVLNNNLRLGKRFWFFSNKVYAADLLPSRDLYFRSHDSLIPNNPPVELNPNQPPIMSENQPIGTVVAHCCNGFRGWIFEFCDLSLTSCRS